jgi:hypothetical protein
MRETQESMEIWSMQQRLPAYVRKKGNIEEGPGAA